MAWGQMSSNIYESWKNKVKSPDEVAKDKWLGARDYGEWKDKQGNYYDNYREYDAYLIAYYYVYVVKTPELGIVAFPYMRGQPWREDFFNTIMVEKELVNRKDFTEKFVQAGVDYGQLSKEKKLKRISKSRIKLTALEKFLEQRVRIKEKRKELLCQSEIRQLVKNFRNRTNYAEMKAFDKKVRALYQDKEKLERCFSNANEFAELFNWHDRGWFGRFNCDLGAFVIAENDAEGKTDEEIEQMALLEAI